MNEQANTGYEAKIYTKDGRHEKVFTDDIFLEKVNQCHHITAIYHTDKRIFSDVEETLRPLLDNADSIFIETRGGAVIATMTLADFFALIELGKRITVMNRERGGRELANTGTVYRDVSDFLRELAS